MSCEIEEGGKYLRDMGEREKGDVTMEMFFAIIF